MSFCIRAGLQTAGMSAQLTSDYRFGIFETLLLANRRFHFYTSGDKLSFCLRPLVNCENQFSTSLHGFSSFCNRRMVRRKQRSTVWTLPRLRKYVVGFSLRRRGFVVAVQGGLLWSLPVSVVSGQPLRGKHLFLKKNGFA